MCGADIDMDSTCRAPSVAAPSRARVARGDTPPPPPLRVPPPSARPCRCGEGSVSRPTLPALTVGCPRCLCGRGRGGVELLLRAVAGTCSRGFFWRFAVCSSVVSVADGVESLPCPVRRIVACVVVMPRSLRLSFIMADFLGMPSVRRGADEIPMPEKKLIESVARVWRGTSLLEVRCVSVPESVLPASALLSRLPWVAVFTAGVRS